MTAAWILLAVVTLGCALAVLRGALRGLLSRQDAAWHCGGFAVTTAVTLALFPAVSGHAFSSHEDQLWLAFQGTGGGGSILEAQPLLRWFYGAAGRLLPRNVTVFVGLAVLLGSFGPVLCGLAGQVLAGNRWVGLLVAAVLATQPSIAYWRLHGFHVAPAFGAFGLCLLLGAVAARRPSRLAYAAWFLAGAWTLSFRMELAGAVVATAAAPLLAGGLRRWRQWAPGLLLSAALLAPIAWAVLTRTFAGEFPAGWHVVPFHLSVPEWGAPVRTSALGLLTLLGLGGLRRHPGAVATGSALLVLGLFPAILFSDFSHRHAHPWVAGGAVLAGVGCLLLVEHAGRLGGGGRGLVVTVCGVLVGSGLSQNVMGQRRLAKRYGDPDRNALISIDGVERPQQALPPSWTDCALYADDDAICSQNPHCHPVKDLREPRLLRGRWDELGGCLLWGVDPGVAWVHGARWERWYFLQRAGDWQPYGRFTVPGYQQEVIDEGQAPKLEWIPERSIEVYRMGERP